MKVFPGLVFLVLILLPGFSWGTCTGPSVISVPYQNMVVNNGNPIGAHNPNVNDAFPWSAPYEPIRFNFSTCSPAPAASIIRPAGNTVPGASYSDEYGSYAVWDIPGVEGIGYLMRVRPYSTDWQAVGTQDIQLVSIDPNPKATDTRLFISTRLYAYGTLSSGNFSIPQALMGYWGLVDASGNAVSTQSHDGLSPIYSQPSMLEVQALTCNVTSPSNQVAILPSVDKIDFSGVGSTVPVSAPFQFSLDCPSSVSLHATMSDGVDPGNTSDVLTLAPESTAIGIGVQIFRQGQATPIAFGPQSPVAGTINQWFVGTGASSYVLPMEARYIQTGDTITPGQVDALATITFSYQ